MPLPSVLSIIYSDLGGNPTMVISSWRTPDGVDHSHTEHLPPFATQEEAERCAQLVHDAVRGQWLPTSDGELISGD